MNITTILFDLDGTLLPMDQDVFAGAYIKGLTEAALSAGYDPGAFSKAVLAGTYAMVKNDGSRTNEDVFWDTIENLFGIKIKHNMHIFNEFYRTDFQSIRSVCGYTPRAKELIMKLREKGYRIVLATNPLFPTEATESRIRWAGLEVGDFEAYTTFENFHYCKPNPDYYKELLDKLNLVPEECLMIGNDTGDDLPAAQLGIRVFLLTDCLINKNNTDIALLPHGSFDELEAFIEEVSRL